MVEITKIAIGFRGATGPEGDQGLKGDKGDQGIQGERGVQGLPGQNVIITTFADPAAWAAYAPGPTELAVLTGV